MIGGVCGVRGWAHEPDRRRTESLHDRDARTVRGSAENVEDINTRLV
jgi:hypothetical protein